MLASGGILCVFIVRLLCRARCAFLVQGVTERGARPSRQVTITGNIASQSSNRSGQGCPVETRARSPPPACSVHQEILIIPCASTDLSLVIGMKPVQRAMDDGGKDHARDNEEHDAGEERVTPGENLAGGR